MNQKRIKCSKIEVTFTVPCTNVVSQEPAQERAQEPAQERAQELAQERALPSQMVNHRVVKERIAGSLSHFLFRGEVFRNTAIDLHRIDFSALTDCAIFCLLDKADNNRFKAVSGSAVNDVKAKPHSCAANCEITIPWAIAKECECYKVQ